MAKTWYEMCQTTFKPIHGRTRMSTNELAADLQLSMKKKMGQTDRELQFVPCINSLTFPPGRLGPYNDKLLHCQLINIIPKNSQHILLPDLFPHLPSNVH
jgi:hypothetical protein